MIKARRITVADDPYAWFPMIYNQSWLSSEINQCYGYLTISMNILNHGYGTKAMVTTALVMDILWPRLRDIGHRYL